MKKILLAISALALLGASAYAEDMDIRALAAKLAAQEARMADQDSRMRDLEAKLYCQDGTGTAESLTSLRKNATVTLGGLVTTGVHYGTGTIERRDGVIPSREKLKATDFTVSDAELYVQVDVSDNFEAAVYLDLHNVGQDAATDYGVAKAYFVRWKNICNTGFSLKVGRDRVAFGDDNNQAGYLDSWVVGNGDGMDWFSDSFPAAIPEHNGWKFNGTTQITPYWESAGGKLKVELSLFQNLWDDTGALINSSVDDARYVFDRGHTRYYRSRNYGLGSGSLRVRYSPIEDLTLTAGVINFRSNRFSDGTFAWDGYSLAKNNTALNLAFRYTPRFLDKLTFWSQWVHGWNVDNRKNLDSDALNAGLSYALTDAVSVFAQGDYLRSRHKDQHLDRTGWASYCGVTYEMPMGAIVEAGWRREYVKYVQDGRVQATLRGDVVYANVGFEF